MDAFSGYNQIKMADEDQEKTAFITSQGLYCYNVMPFGLKNAGATYQKLVNKMFVKQIGRNMEVYVDDMLIKSKEELAHLDDLRETFKTLKQYQMKLNPVSSTAVSAALIREENRKQLPVYYVSQAFQGAEFRYPKIEKITFALIVASRKLRQYFQANPILVMTDQPIRKAMSKPEAAGRMIQWAIELSQFNVEYHPRTAIKAQALADFIAEFTYLDESNQTNEDDVWTIQTDGSSARKRGGVGVVIVTPNGEILKYGVQLEFPATNNKAEYEGILTGLRLGKELGARNVLVRNDSKLVIGQVKGEYEAKEERMQKYLKLTNHLVKEFEKVEFVQIPRSQNRPADEVSKIASSDGAELSTDLMIETQRNPSIEEILTFVVRSESSWMTPIMSFLQDGHLPQDADEARKIKKRATRFTILNNALYKRGFSMPYLRCVDEGEAEYILREVHEGVCGNHAGPRSLTRKIMQTGYFWPTMQDDAAKFVRKSEALATVTETRIQGFVWKNIVCRFGIPRTIISDNGRQFDCRGFRDFCSGLGIKNQFSSPGHPQANGQTEVTNRTLLKIIKAKLDDAKGTWPEELPNVLWAYRTTARTPTGETPFRLTYGTEAVIPVEVGVTSTRREVFNEDENDDSLRFDLDCLDEVRDKAFSRMTEYQKKMTEYYNRRVKLRRLDIGDLVLRKVTQATKDPTQGKLGPTWEGPYKVIHYSRRGSYHLETLDGRKLPRPWNIEHLKKYHQ
nr:uncharacterized protein LOC112008185 [Quercus suber]